MKGSPISFTITGVNGSVTSNQSESHRTVNKRKRKRTGDSSREVSDADDSDADQPSTTQAHNLGSRLAKRIHTANSRKSQLSKTIVPSKPSSAGASPNGSSSHGPTPAAENNANGSAVDRDSTEEDGDVEDSDDLDDWAIEFEKELV